MQQHRGVHWPPLTGLRVCKLCGMQEDNLDSFVCFESENSH